MAHGLVVAGVLLALFNAARTLRRALKTELFLSFVRKNAEAGQHVRIQRAVTLSSSAELCALTQRWLDLELPEVVHAPPGRAGYREPAEVVSIEERVRAALAPYVEKRRARLLASLPWSGIALCVAAAGVALGSEHTWVLGLGLLAGLLALYGGRGVWGMNRDLAMALEVLVMLPRPEPEDRVAIEEEQHGPRRPRRLVVHGPRGSSREFPLEAGIVKIGSTGSADLRLEGEGVSRLHAVLEVGLEEVALIDLGSAEGTWVSGTRVNKHTLVAGDRVTIGEHELEVL